MEWKFPTDEQRELMDKCSRAMAATGMSMVEVGMAYARFGGALLSTSMPKAQALEIVDDVRNMMADSEAVQTVEVIIFVGPPGKLH